MSLTDRRPSFRWFRRSRSAGPTRDSKKDAIPGARNLPVPDPSPDLSSPPGAPAAPGSPVHSDLGHALARSPTTRTASSMASGPSAAYYSRPLPPLPPAHAQERSSVSLNDHERRPACTQSEIGHGERYRPHRTFTEPDPHSNGLADARASPRRPRKLKKPDHARPAQDWALHDPRLPPASPAAPPVSYRAVGGQPKSVPPLTAPIRSSPQATSFAQAMTKVESRWPPPRQAPLQHRRQSSYGQSSEEWHPPSSSSRQPLRPKSMISVDTSFSLPKPTRSSAASWLSSSTGVTVATVDESSTSAAMYFGSGKSLSRSIRKLTKRRPRPRVSEPVPAPPPELARPVPGVYPGKIIPNYSRPFSIIGGNEPPPPRRWESVSDTGHGYSSLAPPTSPGSLTPYRRGFRSITVLDHGESECDEHDAVASPSASFESLPHHPTATLAELSVATADGINVSSSAIAARSSLLRAAERSGSQRDLEFVLDPAWTIGEEGEDEVRQNMERDRP
jgi:hypothetical protein